MTGLTLAEILAATNGHLQGPAPSQDIFTPEQIITDTRQLKPGCLFVPLKGANFDGHHFLAHAHQNGALLSLCERAYATDTVGPLVVVEDSLRAYQYLARAWRRKLNPIVIGITGSSGKTSSKEILAALLLHSGSVHKTQANYNNDVGVAKTLLQLQPQHRWAVVEMAMRGLGQIAVLAETAEPNIGLITNVGQAHLGELGSIDNIATAKWELADYLGTHQAPIALLRQDPLLAGKATTKNAPPILWCGDQPSDTIQLLETHVTEKGQWLRYRTGEQAPRTITINLGGRHQIDNLLLGLAVLYDLQITLPEHLDLEVPILFGRQETLVTANGVTLINDAYNANPDSMKAALQMLVADPRPCERKWAVLAFMGELGEDSDRFHTEVGEFCAHLPLAGLGVIGAGAQAIATAAVGHDFPVFYWDSHEAAIDGLKELLQRGDLVLLKASRSMQLETIVQALTGTAVAHP